MTALPVELEARFAVARQIADAVLFEGYVLYPYRASAAKNRLRWQFGVLVPPSYGADSAEHSEQRTECVMEPRRGADLAVQLRFLRAQRRTVQRVLENGEFETVPELELADRVLVPWDEGIEERVELIVPVDKLTGTGIEHPFRSPAREEQEEVLEDGVLVGRLLRQCEQLDGVVRLRTQELPGPYRAVRLVAEVANSSTWQPGTGDPREAALPRSLVSAHLLLGLDQGAFLSATDPPQWAKAAVAECRSEHTWPVLVGPPGQDSVLLSSPIILEDHPQVAPESPGALYDATEIDEILALRTAALTDREKREARGTDERAGAVIDLADSLPAEVLERLHGAVRALREVTAPTAPAADQPWWDPGNDPQVDPDQDRVLVDGRSVGAGSRVLLKPGRRRTDAQDLFLHGRTALVEAVLHDVDGEVHLAVTVEGDPGADLWRAQGRFRYFQPDEVTPLEGE
ncbi:hypothetical protein OG455_02840 [Kitasatospora sp. NBC_01287]|uniref:hypothetical protein n=1 Tax=Kitasatospora sp. NBC_01287 TaxID=2903573 RepID=UPI00224F18E7|nr:hypothetical protein [Kitasatospora sp. NBC_01287]MCX4744464.1 hypothetical protein [Kitasatospora sp. NBC_01287]